MLLLATCCSFAQVEYDDPLPVTPPKKDLASYKHMMDTFDMDAFGWYRALYPEDEDSFPYRMLFYAHNDSRKFFIDILSDFAYLKFGLERSPFDYRLSNEIELDPIYRNINYRFRFSRFERYPQKKFSYSDFLYYKYLNGHYLPGDSAFYLGQDKNQAFSESETNDSARILKNFRILRRRCLFDYIFVDGNGPEKLLPLPSSTNLDSLKIKIINNIDIQAYNDYVANYPEDVDRLMLALYMIYATRCEQSYKVMCNYISTKYGYRNPELTQKVVLELQKQRERLGPYCWEILQDECLCEDTAKEKKVNRYIFDRMAYVFTDNFFREYMIQSEDVKQQFLCEVSCPLSEDYDIQACYDHIAHSTILSEQERCRLLNAIKYNRP